MFAPVLLIQTIEQAFYAAIYGPLHYAQENAGYKCAGYECHPDSTDERVAFFTLTLTAFTGFVTGALFWATFRLYKTTVIAVEATAADAAEVRRPWIKVYFDGPKKARLIDDVMLLDFNAFMMNVGLTPATQVFAYVTGQGNWGDAERALLTAHMSIYADRKRPPGLEIGRTVFPGATAEQPAIVSFNVKPKLGTTQYISGTVYYRIPGDQRACFTPFVLSVFFNGAPDANGIVTVQTKDHYLGTPAPT
jgi:hypothetical protein